MLLIFLTLLTLNMYCLVCMVPLSLSLSLSPTSALSRIAMPVLCFNSAEIIFKLGPTISRMKKKVAIILI